MVGTNKRHADSIDQRAAERAAVQSGQSAGPIPALQELAAAMASRAHLRVGVGDSARQSHRALVGHFSALHEADRSILFAGA